MGLCIIAGGTTVAAYAGIAAFTLAWTHTVERTEWREDWQVAGDRLVLVEAHTHGDAAGLQVPAGARLESSGWSWRPAIEPVPELILRRSDATADWRVCMDGECRDLAAAADADPVRLVACTARDGSLDGASVYNPSDASATEDPTRAR
jgi:hypothetical protein